jgi:hypothetical protein
VKTHHSGEKVREESFDIAQERAFALHASKLPEESQGDDFRVRKPLERLVAPRTGVEQRVGTVDKTKQAGNLLFRPVKSSAMVGAGHLLLLREGRLWPLSNPRQMHTTYLVPDYVSFHQGISDAPRRSPP